nr:MSHA biogenesis protein MshK [Shewanella intestini]
MRIKTKCLTLIIALSSLSVLSANSQTLRDPTLPGRDQVVTEVGTQQQSLVLNSIVNGSTPYAVINDTILSIGDIIQGRKISYIGQDYVNFTDGSKLQLFMSIKKR